MINLLPYKEKKSIEKIRSIRLASTTAGAVVVIFIIAGTLLFPTFITINSRSSLAINQIKTLEQDGDIASDVDIASLENRAQNVQAKLSIPTTVQPTYYVELIKSIAPVGIVVDRFNLQETNSLEVFGITDSREILQGFIRSLESNEKILSVDSPVSNFVKSKNSLFKLKILFK